ncbi:MAG TPA: hypothetical protein VK891_01430 [Euzebyales bacterium]|nr:hypothetical protein [Euzebyales bacterium]
MPDGVADAFQDGSRWPLKSEGLEACGEFGAVVGELLSAGGQVFDAGCAGVVRHGAGFERAEVAAERSVGFAELLVDARELLLDVGSVVGGGDVGGCDGLVEQVEVAVLISTARPARQGTQRRGVADTGR